MPSLRILKCLRKSVPMGWWFLRLMVTFLIFSSKVIFCKGLQLAPLRSSPNVTHFYKVLLPFPFSNLSPRPLFSPVGESFLNFNFITDKSNRTCSYLILNARHGFHDSRLQCRTKVSLVLHGLLLDRDYVKKSKRARSTQAWIKHCNQVLQTYRKRLTGLFPSW